MNNKTILEAIANITSASKAIQDFCNDESKRCSPYAAQLLEQTALELLKQAADLEEINYQYVS